MSQLASSIGAAIGRSIIKQVDTSTKVQDSAQKCPPGLDCSAFTQKTLAGLGVNVPRTAVQQYRSTIKVTGSGGNYADLRPGDLVFFDNGRRDTYNTQGKKVGANAYVNHVGIYIGNGQFIHDPGKSSDNRTVQDLRQYLKRTGFRFMGAGRPKEFANVGFGVQNTPQVMAQADAKRAAALKAQATSTRHPSDQKYYAQQTATDKKGNLPPAPDRQPGLADQSVGPWQDLMRIVKKSAQQETIRRRSTPGTLEVAMAEIDQRLHGRINPGQRKVIKDYLWALGGFDGIRGNHLHMALKMAGQGQYAYMKSMAAKAKRAGTTLVESLDFTPEALTFAFDTFSKFVKTKTGGMWSFNDSYKRWIEAGGTPEIGSGPNALDDPMIYWSDFGRIRSREENMRISGRPYKQAKEDDPFFYMGPTQNLPARVLSSTIKSMTFGTDPEIQRQVIDQELETDLVKGANTVSNFARYFIPGLKQMAMTEDAASIMQRVKEVGGRQASAEFLQSLIDGNNPFAAGIAPAERVTRGISAILTGLGISKVASKAWSRGSRNGAAGELSSRLRISRKQAMTMLLEAEAYARSYIKQQEKLFEAGLPLRPRAGTELIKARMPQPTLHRDPRLGEWATLNKGGSPNPRPVSSQKGPEKSGPSSFKGATSPIVTSRGFGGSAVSSKQPLTPQMIEFHAGQVRREAIRSARSIDDVINDLPEHLRRLVAVSIKSAQGRLKVVRAADVEHLVDGKTTKIGFTIADKATLSEVTLPSGARLRMYGGPGFRLEGADPGFGDGNAWASSTQGKADLHHSRAAQGAPFQFTVSNADENVFASHAVLAMRAEMQHAMVTKSVSLNDLLYHARKTVAAYNATKVGAAKKLHSPTSVHEFLASLDHLDTFESRALFAKKFWASDRGGTKPANPFGATWKEVAMAMNEPSTLDRRPGDLMNLLHVDRHGVSARDTGHPIYPWSVKGTNYGLTANREARALLPALYEQAQASFATQRKPILEPTDAQIRNRVRGWLTFGHGHYVPGGIIEVDTQDFLAFLEYSDRRIKLLESQGSHKSFKNKQAGAFDTRIVELALLKAIRHINKTGADAPAVIRQVTKDLRLTANEVRSMRFYLYFLASQMAGDARKRASNQGK